MQDVRPALMLRLQRRAMGDDIRPVAGLTPAGAREDGHRCVTVAVQPGPDAEWGERCLPAAVATHQAQPHVALAQLAQGVTGDLGHGAHVLEAG
jgi:hypothetical protein